MVDTEERNVEDALEEDAANPTTEDVAEELQETKTELQDATNPDASETQRDAALTNAGSDLTETSTNLGEEWDTEGNDLSQEENKDLSGAKVAVDAVEEQGTEIKEGEEEQRSRTRNLRTKR
ncbi:hypothetical protein AK830_g2113 [Neonectria ditissima]|uniref:Uncharacterized protein n=1 Tax=Neonectria ditissima TaxID=78410 RepID=A0A0P7BST5_9HYPO|nr:hypothetical protein AK830_g2113 [Neonectria ditissima]